MDLFLTSVVSCVNNINALKRKIDNKTRLVILPFAHDYKYINCAEDIYNHYDRCLKNEESIFWHIARPFIDIGIDERNIVVINQYEDHPNLIKHKLLDFNTVVYFPGGRPENITKALRKLGLVETIKQCKTGVGESAGSMFWNKRYFVFRDDIDYYRYHNYKGINLIKNLVFIPHFKLGCDNDHIRKAAKRFSIFHKDTIYLVQDGGWIHYNTDMQKIIDRKGAIRY